MKYTAFLVVLTFELQVTIQQCYRTKIHLWNIHKLMSLQPHGTCEELFFSPTSLSQTLNNEEQKRYETTCLCVSFEIFSYITLLSVLKTSRYSSSSEYIHRKNTQQNTVPVDTAFSSRFSQQNTKQIHGGSGGTAEWGVVCVKGWEGSILPNQLVKKIDIYYPSWKKQLSFLMWAHKMTLYRKLSNFLSITAWIKSWPPQKGKRAGHCTGHKDLDNTLQFSPCW